MLKIERNSVEQRISFFWQKKKKTFFWKGLLYAAILHLLATILISIPVISFNNSSIIFKPVDVEATIEGNNFSLLITDELDIETYLPQIIKPKLNILQLLPLQLPHLYFEKIININSSPQKLFSSLHEYEWPEPLKNLQLDGKTTQFSSKINISGEVAEKTSLQNYFGLPRFKEIKTPTFLRFNVILLKDQIIWYEALQLSPSTQVNEEVEKILFSLRFSPKTSLPLEGEVELTLNP